MLKFFRRIRWKLLDEDDRSEVLPEQKQSEALTERTAKRVDRLKRYLIYAIGEILLVVIGILLALQINNWNEAQKSREESFQTLKELKTDLQKTIPRLQANKRGCEMNLFHIERIIDFMHPDSSYSVVLDKSFFLMDKYGTTFIPRDNYEVLKAKRFRFVTNDSLRSEITNFYEEVYYIIKEDVEFVLRSGTENLVQPFAKKNFRDLTLGTVRPNNYNLLKKDEEFLNIIYGLRTTRQFAVERYTYDIKNTEKLIQKIDQALEDW